MPLTTPAGWADAMTASAPRWGVTITQPAGETHAFVSGAEPVTVSSTLIAAPSIVRVSPNVAAIDPFTRAAQPMSIDVVMSAEAARGIESSLGLVGRTARIYVGADGLPWTSWLLRFAAMISDVQIGTDGTATLTCVDLVDLLFRLKVSGVWVATHPRDVLVDIVSALPGDVVSTSIPAAETDRTHWSVTRAAALPYGSLQGAMYDPRQKPTGTAASLAQPVSAYLGDLLTMLGWTLSHGANGVVEIRLPRTPTDRDIPPDDVKRVASMRLGEWMTKVRIEYMTEPQESLLDVIDLDANRPLAERELESNSSRRFVLAEDNTYQDQTGSPKAERERDLTAAWVNGACVIGDGYSLRDPGVAGGRQPSALGITQTTEQLALIDAPVAGMTGFRWRQSFKYENATSAVAVSGVVTFSGVGSISPFSVGDEITYTERPAIDSLPLYHATITAVSLPTITATTTDPDHSLGAVTLWIAQHPDDRPSVSRPVYLQIRGDDDGTPEIVRVTREPVPSPLNVRGSFVSPGGSGSLMSYRGRDWPRVLYVDITRAQLGTTASTAGVRSIVSDVTIPYAMALDRLSRFLRGCPTVDLELAPRHADLQEGDIVTFVGADLWSRWHLPAAGATTDVRWEVVSVAPDLDAGCVRVSLAWLSTATPIYTAIPTAAVDLSPPWVDLGQPPAGSCYWPQTTGRRLEGPATQIEGTTDITVSVWVRADVRENGHTLVSRWGGADNCWRIEMRNNGSLRVYAATSGTDSSNYVSTAANAIVTGQWHHVAFTFAAGSPATVAVYVDGAPVTTTLTGTLPTSLRASSAEICVGADSAGGGQIDRIYMAHVIVWAKALAGAQIATLITGSGRPASPPMREPSNRPVAWWPLASTRGALGGGLLEQGTTPGLIFGTEYP